MTESGNLGKYVLCTVNQCTDTLNSGPYVSDVWQL